MNRSDAGRALLDELQIHGGSLNGVSTEEFAADNLGLVATKDLSAGTLVVTVPSALLVTPQRGYGTRRGAVLFRICNQANIVYGHEAAEYAAAKLASKFGVFLAFALLEVTPGGVFGAHRAALPSPADLSSNPVFWDEVDKASLKTASSFCFSKYQGEVAAWKREYEDVASLLALDPAGEAMCTLDEWLWAKAIIASRNMQVPATANVAGLATQLPGLSSISEAGEASDAADVGLTGTVPIVVPLADLANHSSDANVFWGLNPRNGNFEMRTKRAVAAGEQLCYDYGQQPTWKYLLHYGFVPAEANQRRPKGLFETELVLQRLLVDLVDVDEVQKLGREPSYDPVVMNPLHAAHWAAAWTSLGDGGGGRRAEPGHSPPHATHAAAPAAVPDPEDPKDPKDPKDPVDAEDEEGGRRVGSGSGAAPTAANHQDNDSVGHAAADDSGAAGAAPSSRVGTGPDRDPLGRQLPGGDLAIILSSGGAGGSGGDGGRGEMAMARFGALLMLARGLVSTTEAEAAAVAAVAAAASASGSPHLLTPLSRANERQALGLLAQVLEKRVGTLKRTERALVAKLRNEPTSSSALRSIVELIKGEAWLLRAVKRVVEDALLVASALKPPPSTEHPRPPRPPRPPHASPPDASQASESPSTPTPLTPLQLPTPLEPSEPKGEADGHLPAEADAEACDAEGEQPGEGVEVAPGFVDGAGDTDGAGGAGDVDDVDVVPEILAEYDVANSEWGGGGLGWKNCVPYAPEYVRLISLLPAATTADV